MEKKDLKDSRFNPNEFLTKNIKELSDQATEIHDRILKEAFYQGYTEGMIQEIDMIDDAITWFTETNESEYVLYNSHSIHHLLSMYKEYLASQTAPEDMSQLEDLEDCPVNQEFID